MTHLNMVIPKPDSFTALAPDELPPNCRVIENDYLATVWFDTTHWQVLNNLLEERYDKNIQRAQVGV